MEFRKYFELTKHCLLKLIEFAKEYLLVKIVYIYLWKAENELDKHSSGKDSKINLEQIESSK